MFPIAPARMALTERIRHMFDFFLIRDSRNQVIPMIAAILNRLSTIFPVFPPISIPNAIPLFSIKCSNPQFPNKCISCPMTMCVFTHNLRIWSAMRIRMINNRVFFPDDISILFLNQVRKIIKMWIKADISGL